MSFSQTEPYEQSDLRHLVSLLAAEATELGFALFGVAPAVTPAGFHQLVQWLELGYAADMAYFQNRLDAYRDPDMVLKGVRSVIVLGFPYRTVAPAATQPHHGRVARYAWGTADYHDILHSRLNRMKELIASHYPDSDARGVVDSAPIMEREFAQLAGLGWTGKNSLLLNRSQGSYFFLSCLLSTLQLPASTPFESDHCGTCRKCLEACPTNAFVSPGVLDSRRCISYQTIENRGPIPIEFRSMIGDWVFGCDVCQEVCPWNRFGEPTQEASLLPLPSSNPIDLLDLITLSEDQYRARFRKTPLWRPRRRGMLRNAAICLGNARDPRAIQPLIRLLDDDETLVRGAVAWALGNYDQDDTLEALRSRRLVEADEYVQTELAQAIARLQK